MSEGIKWGRGFFRLWLVYGALVLTVTSTGIYDVAIDYGALIIYDTKTNQFTNETMTLGQMIELGDAKKNGSMVVVEFLNHSIYFPAEMEKSAIDAKMATYPEWHRSYLAQKVTDKRFSLFYIGMFILLTPLILGLIIKWITGGFRPSRKGAQPVP